MPTVMIASAGTMPTISWNDCAATIESGKIDAGSLILLSSRPPETSDGSADVVAAEKKLTATRPMKTASA